MSKLEFRSCSCLYDLTFVTKKATLCFEEFKDLLEKFGHKLPYVFFFILIMIFILFVVS